MTPAGKHAFGRAETSSCTILSAVEPLELSGRPDSGTPSAPRSTGGPVELARDKRGNEIGDLTVTVTEWNQVNEAASWIRMKVAATLRQGAQDVGDYILTNFFGGDPDLARSKNPYKVASFRALAEKCGTPELPVSKTWLNNAVGIAVINLRLPESAFAFRALPPSFQEALLPIRHPEKVESIARQVEKQALTCRQLRQLVAREKPKSAQRPRARQRSASQVLKVVNQLLLLLGPDDCGRSCSVADLDPQQSLLALHTIQSLVEKLHVFVRITDS